MMKLNERILAVSLFGMVFIAAVTLPCFGQLQDSAWPGLQGDIRHTGRSDYVGPADPTLKWKYPVGWCHICGPSIDKNGTIYMGGGENDSLLHAIYPNGDQKWTYGSTGDDCSSGVPAVNVDGTVYVPLLGEHTSDWRGQLHAVTPSGNQKWSAYKVPELLGEGTWFGCSPSIDPADGTIFIPDFNNKPYRGGLSAVDPGDGTNTWYSGISKTNPERDPWSAVAIDPGKGNLYFGASGKPGDNRLLCHSRYISKFKWTYETGGHIVFSPAIDDNGTIYFGSWDKKLYALNSLGICKWSFATGDSVTYSPCISWDNETIYFGSRDKRFYAVNAADGSLKWFYQTNGKLTGSAIVDANGDLYFGSNDKYFYSLSPNGTLRWKFPIKQLVAIFNPDPPPSSGPGDPGISKNICIVNYLIKNMIDPDGSGALAGEEDLVNNIKNDYAFWFGYVFPWLESGDPLKIKDYYYVWGKPGAHPAMGDDGTIYFNTSLDYLFAIGD